MSEPDDYPTGVPCWVQGLHRDPAAACDFYAALMGWDFAGSGGEPEHFVARVRGREVAGLSPLPQTVGDVEATWITHVAVDSATATAAAAVRAGGALLAEPSRHPAGGSMALLADPTGAVFGAWERGARRGAQLINEPGAWAMSALRTTDPNATADFYGRLFGWIAEPFGPPEAGIALFRLPGYVGGTETQPVPQDVVAVSMPLEPDDRPHWHLDFWVPDASDAVDRARATGGTVVIEPQDAPPFKQAELADPQGAVITISELTVA